MPIIQGFMHFSDVLQDQVQTFMNTMDAMYSKQKESKLFVHVAHGTHRDLVVRRRSAVKRQLNTGWRTHPLWPLAQFPWIWYTTGLHSGSPPNWNTNLGSGSVLTTRWSRAADVWLPMLTHPLCTTAARVAAVSRSTATLTRPSNRPELNPHVLPVRPTYTDTSKLARLPDDRCHAAGSTLMMTGEEDEEEVGASIKLVLEVGSTARGRGTEQ